MSSIIIFILVLIVFALLSFIYYLFAWRKNLIKDVPIEVENLLIVLNKKIDDQFTDTNKHIQSLEDKHTQYQQDILNRISSGTSDNIDKIKTKFQEIKDELDKFKQDLHNKVNNTNTILENLIQEEQDIAEANKLGLEKTDKCIRDNLLVQISEIKNQLDALQEYALKNNQKIRRFEDGYDLKIQNEFVIDIINTIEYLEKQNKKSKNNDLEIAIEDLNIMLENNSIYKIELKMDNYKGQEIKAKVASTEPTSDPSKNYVIKEILKNGYYIEISDTQKVIKPAEVIIYKLEEQI